MFLPRRARRAPFFFSPSGHSLRVTGATCLRRSLEGLSCYVVVIKSSLHKHEAATRGTGVEWEFLATLHGERRREGIPSGEPIWGRT